ncbi:hypothetical protein BgiMline_009178, partial [Biomphalaria glabrata]
SKEILHSDVCFYCWTFLFLCSAWAASRMVQEHNLLAVLMDAALKEAGLSHGTLSEPMGRLLLEAVDIGVTNVVVQILARNLKDCIY